MAAEMGRGKPRRAVVEPRLEEVVVQLRCRRPTPIAKVPLGAERAAPAINTVRMCGNAPSAQTRRERNKKYLLRRYPRVVLVSSAARKRETETEREPQERRTRVACYSAAEGQACAQSNRSTLAESVVFVAFIDYHTLYVLFYSTCTVQ